MSSSDLGSVDTTVAPVTDNEQVARDLFLTLDSDGDGFLTGDDLRLFIEDEGKLEEILILLDPQQSGRVGMDAWVESFAMFMGDADQEEGELEDLDLTEIGVEGNETQIVIENAGKDDAAAASQSSAVNGNPAAAAAPSVGEHMKRVSFAGPAAPTTPIQLSVPHSTNSLKPPEPHPRRASRASGRLQLRKGYASLKHSLILDELRHAPGAAAAAAGFTLTPAQAADVVAAAEAKSQSSTIPAAAASNGSLPASAATSTTSSPAVSTPSTPQRGASSSSTSTSTSTSSSNRRRSYRSHRRMQSSVDYSFSFSKTHVTLMERAGKILKWCEESEEQNEKDRTGQHQHSATSPTASSSSTHNSISLNELDTSMHYLARALTPEESGRLSKLVGDRNLSAVPLSMFRKTLQNAIAGSGSDTNKTAPVDADAFVAKFMAILQGQLERMGEHESEAAAAAMNNHPTTPKANAAAGEGGDISPVSNIHHRDHSASATSSSSSSTSASATETLVANLRQSLRLLENEHKALKSKLSRALVHTSSLDMENAQLRAERDSHIQAARRSEDLVTELRASLDTHKALLQRTETNLAVSQATLAQCRDEQQAQRAELELERKSRAKCLMDLERQTTLVHTLQSASQAAHRLNFRERLEEMSKIMGSHRYVRKLQLDASRTHLVESQLHGAQATIRTLEATIAEQQRILNELQRDRIERMAATPSTHARLGLGADGEAEGAPSRKLSSPPELSGATAADNAAGVGSGPQSPTSPAAPLDAATESSPDLVHSPMPPPLSSPGSSSAAASPGSSYTTTPRHSVVHRPSLTLSLARTPSLAPKHSLLDDLEGDSDEGEGEEAEQKRKEKRNAGEGGEGQESGEGEDGDEVRSAFTSPAKSSTATTWAQQQVLDLRDQLRAAQEAASNHFLRVEALENELLQARASLAGQVEATALEAAQQKAQAVSEAVESVRKELDEQHAKALESLKEEHKAALSKLTKEKGEEMANAKATLQKRYEEEVQQIKSSQMQALQRVQDSLSESQKREELAKKQVEELDQKIEQLKAQLTQQQQQQQQQLRQLQQATAARSVTTESQQQPSTSPTADHAQALSRVTHLESELRSLESTCSALRQQVAALNESESSLSQEVGELQTALERSSDRVQQLQQQIQEERERNEAREKKDAEEMTMLKQKIQQLQAQKDELEAWIQGHVCDGSKGRPTSPLTIVTGSSASATASTTSSSLTPTHSLDPMVQTSTATLSAGHVAQSNSGSLLSPASLVSPPSTTARDSFSAPASVPMAVASIRYAPLARLNLRRSQVLEVHSYATACSMFLASDPDLAHLFPLDLRPPMELDINDEHSANAAADDSTHISDPVISAADQLAGYGLDLLQKLKDGLLLAALINFVAPRTIDTRVLNKRGSSADASAGDSSTLEWHCLVENLNVVITSAKAIGISMRVPQEEEAILEDAYTKDATFPKDGIPSTPGHRSRRSSMGSSIGGNDDEFSAALAASALSSPDASGSYVGGLELSSAQLLLLNPCGRAEHVGIVLDFLFQLLKHGCLSRLVGPEKSKLSRLSQVVKMPHLQDMTKKEMIARTKSLQPPSNQTQTKSESPAGSTGRKLPSRMAKYGTFSKAAFASVLMAGPSGSSSSSSSSSTMSPVEHARLVAHFNSSLIADHSNLSDLRSVPPETLLLRWVNAQIMAEAQEGGGISESEEESSMEQFHFVATLADLDVSTYSVLLQRIHRWRSADEDASTLVPPPSSSSLTPASLLDYLSSQLNVSHFHSPACIRVAHERLGLLLLARIFDQWPMSDEVTQRKMGHRSAKSMVADDDSPTRGPRFQPGPMDMLSEEDRDCAALTSFLNSLGLPGVRIHSLFDDIRSGVVLLRFVDALTSGSEAATAAAARAASGRGGGGNGSGSGSQVGCGGVVDWRAVDLRPRNRFQCCANLDLFLTLARQHLNLPFVNIGAPDIYGSNNQKYVLAILWQLMRKHTMQRLEEVRGRLLGGAGAGGGGGKKKEITDGVILEWANQKVASSPILMVEQHNCLTMKNFQDPRMRFSYWLLNLLHALRSGCVDWGMVESVPVTDKAPGSSSVPGGGGGGGGKGTLNPLADETAAILFSNASYAISTARKLGAEIFIEAPDILACNQKKVLLMVASLMAIEEEEDQ